MRIGVLGDGETRGPSWRPLVGVVLAVVLVAAACGDDGIVAVDGGDSAAYCAISQEQRDRDDGFDPLTTNPEEMEAYVASTLDAIDEALPIAPPETRPHLETIRTAFVRLGEVLADNGWDFMAAGAEVAELFESADLDAADSALDDYDEDVCGIDIGDGGDIDIDGDDPFSSPEALAALLETEFGRELFAEGMAEDGTVTFDQALCIAEMVDVEILVAMSFEGQEPSGEILASFFRVLDDCEIDAGNFIGG